MSAIRPIKEQEIQQNTILQLLKEHGWGKYFKVELLDAEPMDIEIAIPNGKTIKKDFLGKNIKNYNSMLVLSHFKGHPMGGFGGALKQLSIGCASSAGKAYIHSAGKAKRNRTRAPKNSYNKQAFLNFNKFFAFL